MARNWMLGGLAAVALASAVWARPGIVKTNDGQSFDGDVSEQDDQVIVDHKGIHTTIPRERIRSLTYADSIDQEYRRRLNKLTRYDVPGRMELAHWLFDNKAYDLAAQVLEEARQIKPHNADIADMMRTVQRQVDLDERETRRHGPVELAAADNNPRGVDPPARAPAKSPAAGRLLTPEEINLVKQAEWQEGQQIKSIKFENDVRRRYVAREGINPADFNRLPPYQQAWAILQHGTDDMKKDVILVGDPPVMFQFKKVQQQVLIACGNCHNPDKPAGNFALHVPGSNEAELYTNFIILQKYHYYKTKDRDYVMINRERPEDSVLVQFALPPDIADPPHPQAANYHGVVRTRNDVKYKTMVDWISALSPVAPDYSEIDLSARKAASRPSGGGRVGRPQPQSAPLRGAGGS